MSGSKTLNPTVFEVKGNMVPVEVSNPTTISVFTVNNCTLTVESAVNVDGNMLKPIRSTPAW